MHNPLESWTNFARSITINLIWLSFIGQWMHVYKYLIISELAVRRIEHFLFISFEIVQ